MKTQLAIVMILAALTNWANAGHNRLDKQAREMHDQFMDAIENGDVDEAEKLIKESRDIARQRNTDTRHIVFLSDCWLVNRKNKKRNQYPIHAAVLTSPAMTKLLLNSYADPNMPSPSGENALQLAIRERKHSSMRYLVETSCQYGHGHGQARPNKKDQDGNNALHLFVRANAGDYFPESAFQDLLNAGAQINDRNYKGDTPLHTAVECRDNSLIALLLAAHANPLLKNVEGKLPSDYARDMQKGDGWLCGPGLVKQLEEAEKGQTARLADKQLEKKFSRAEQKQLKRQMEEWQHFLEGCVSRNMRPPEGVDSEERRTAQEQKKDVEQGAQKLKESGYLCFPDDEEISSGSLFDNSW